MATVKHTKNVLNILYKYLSQPHEGNFYSSLENSDIALIPLTKLDCHYSLEALWNDYVNTAKKEREKEMSVITYQDASMPIWFKTFGEQPFGEKSLFIS